MGIFIFDLSVDILAKFLGTVQDIESAQFPVRPNHTS